MAHTLPTRPSFLPPPPDPEIPSSLLAESDDKTVPKGAEECIICHNTPKYTCPGCTRKTCSLPCSKAHKTTYGCDGKRNNSAFIPLKDVTEGTWSDDYTYLEEGRRKIAEWGGSLPNQVLSAISSEKRNDSRGFKRKRSDKLPGLNGSLRFLHDELERRGVRVDFMAEGMERRRKNQSAWNVKTQTLYLSVQLIFPKTSHFPDGKTIFQPRLSFPSTAQDQHTLSSISPKEIDTSNLIFVLPYHHAEDETMPWQGHTGRRFYPPLDPEISIVDALKGTRYVEFPVISVFETQEWEGKVKRGEFLVVPLSGQYASLVTPSVGSLRRISDSPAAPLQSSPPNPTQPPKSSAPALNPLAPLGLGLGEYGSDDDE